MSAAADDRVPESDAILADPGPDRPQPSPDAQEAPRETALVDVHRALGGRLIDFAGWLMPVQYAGILEEHRAVRERAGLFDLSHMGELFVEGADAGDGLAAALVTDPRTLAIGRAQYSMLCAADGGIIDDLIVYRLGSERFLVVANAGNAAVVSDELAARLSRWKAVLDDRSLATSLVAIQGPRAASILGPMTDVDLAGLRYYAIAEGEVAGLPALVARTGYTGEDGFEVFVDWARGPSIWEALAAAGRAEGLLPVGLGARDTLRLEAGMPLYGNELDLATNPFEAGLGRVVKLEKPGDFVGRPALERDAHEPLRKRLVGLRITGRGIARHGYPVLATDRPTGLVTSGTQSPSLGYPIAMAYVAPEDGEAGTMLEVEIRDRLVAAEVVPLPFYKRRAGATAAATSDGISGRATSAR
jgi:aminomethyltransferase